MSQPYLERGKRDVAITIRTSKRERSLIDQAAKKLGLSRTEFLLESACNEAQQVLLDTNQFALNTKDFKRFVELLEAPPPNLAGLRRLLEKESTLGMTLPKLHPPTPLRPPHRFDDFDSGVPVLDDWLRKRALNNQASGASRTFVVCTDDDEVAGYYCLSAGSVIHALAPKPLRRNMPDPIPVVVMGRLAIDKRYHRMGLGRGLLKDAVLRTLNSAETLGITALLVHAISEDAKNFYLANGFVESPTQPLTLCLALDNARKIIVAP